MPRTPFFYYIPSGDKNISYIERLDTLKRKGIVAMKQIFERISRTSLVALMAVLLLAPSVSFASSIDESPSAGAMVADAVVARPVLLAFTVVGTALYLVTLPFSWAGGNADEAAEQLVIGPAKSTFVRCLGCINSGRKK